jgi:hypothetical protein
MKKTRKGAAYNIKGGKMYLDEQYIRDLGIADMPEDIRNEFMDSIEQLIQGRVNLKVVDRVSDELLDEYDDINNGPIDNVKAWLKRVLPYYEGAADYKAVKEAAVDMSEEDFVREYARVKWLGMNVPDYMQIIAETMNEVKEEILTQQELVLNRS